MIARLLSFLVYGQNENETEPVKWGVDPLTPLQWAPNHGDFLEDVADWHTSSSNLFVKLLEFSLKCLVWEAVSADLAAMASSKAL